MYVTNDAFRFVLRRLYPSIKIKRELYWTIINLFLKHIADLLHNGDAIELPCKLGRMAIYGIPESFRDRPRIEENNVVRNLPVSWKRTIEYWRDRAKALGISMTEYMEIPLGNERRYVYNFNEHTNGLTYKLMYSNRDTRVEGKTYYMFVSCRGFKRKLAELIEDGKEYVDLARQRNRNYDRIKITKKDTLNLINNI